jgi:hypothetical protein
MLTFTDATRDAWLDRLRDLLKQCDPLRSSIIEHRGTRDDPHNPNGVIADLEAGMTITIALNGGAK